MAQSIPTVSIGVPVYNGEVRLRQVIGSLLAQTFKDFELIISDNASTDATEAICREFAAGDPRIRYVRQPKNIGAGANFKFVLDEARGRYFTWVAADDLRSPDFLEENVKFLEAHPDYVASTCPNCFEGQDPEGPDLVTFAIDDEDPEQRLQTFFDYCWISHGIFYSLIRLEILKTCDAVGAWFLGADWAVNLFIARHGPIHRTDKGLMISGRGGLSNSRKAWSAFRTGIVSWIFPFHRVSAYTWRLSSGLPWRQRLRLLRRLWRLNLYAARSQARAEYGYSRYIRPGLQKLGVGRLLPGLLRQEHPLVKAYMVHNRRLFQWRGWRRWRRPEVLLEFNYAPVPNLIPWHISYSYLANVLADEHGARIVAYAPRALDPRTPAFTQSRPFQLGFQRSGMFHSLPQCRIYKSFGVSKFFDVRPCERQKKLARTLYEKIQSNLNAKADVEKIDIDGVRIGDLIYDTYLRVCEKGTIDLKSDEFQNIVYEALCQFVFWQEYFDAHDVRAVNVSHTASTLAIPMRIAVSRGISAFEPHIDHVARLSDQHLSAHSDFLFHREWFAALPADEQERARAEARRHLDLPVSGEVTGSRVSPTRSTSREESSRMPIQPSERTRILVETGCFLGSPHAYGDNLFPDFYEWMDFLGTVSQVTDYDWYIRMDPDHLPASNRILDSLSKKYRKFRILPSDVSLRRLRAEGINVALTVCGTTGVEHAALGIPVVSVSKIVPNRRYGFSLHPESIGEYTDILFSLDSLAVQIDPDEVLEGYYMENVYTKCRVFFRDYGAVVAGLGGFRNQFTPAIYGLWVNECTPERHNSIMKSVRAFVRSGDYLMSERHIAGINKATP